MTVSVFLISVTIYQSITRNNLTDLSVQSFSLLVYFFKPS